jgi:large subunit ribosomal protein L25
MLTLKTESRDKSHNLDTEREAGKIPAVFYGKKEASTSIFIPKIDFLKVWKEAGESTVVTLKTDAGDKDSLIKEVVVDPITGVPVHADFYVFEKGHKIELEIPIEFEGESIAVKSFGGILTKVLHALKIEADPAKLPHSLIIDVSVLENIGDQVLAGELKLPEGVELKENPEEVVVLVAAPREEKEEESAPVDLSSIEVEKKGKEESEEDAEAAA